MLFSIIIPVYNSYEYLDNCLNTIIKQTFLDFEVILINDGSTDSSLEICNNFAQKDKRFKVVDKKNTGVSDSRNIGIDKAQGDYLVFIDSDDYVEYDFLETIYKHIAEVKYKLDILFFGLVNEDEKKNILFYTKSDYRYFSKQEKSEAITYLVDNDMFGYQCSKVIKSSIIKDNNLKLDTKVNLNEDLLFTCDCFDYIENICIIPICKYHYLHRNQSLSNIKRKDCIDEQQFICGRLFDFYNKYNVIDKERLIVERSILSLFICINNSSDNKEINEKLVKTNFFKELYINRKKIKKIIRGKKKIPLLLILYTNSKLLLNIFTNIQRKRFNNYKKL